MNKLLLLTTTSLLALSCSQENRQAHLTKQRKNHVIMQKKKPLLENRILSAKNSEDLARLVFSISKQQKDDIGFFKKNIFLLNDTRNIKSKSLTHVQVRDLFYAIMKNSLEVNFDKDIKTQGQVKEIISFYMNNQSYRYHLDNFSNENFQELTNEVDRWLSIHSP